MAGVAPAVKIICEGLKETDLSMTWDMNPATAFSTRNISVKGIKTRSNKDWEGWKRNPCSHTRKRHPRCTELKHGIEVP